MDVLVSNSDDSGTGSLRQAISLANAGDTITFSPSLTGATILLASQIEIPVGKNIAVDGKAAGGIDLEISGGNTSRIFFVTANAVTPTFFTVKNLTLTAGKTAEQGGAIGTTDEVALFLENVLFANNVADRGGGAIFSGFNNTLTVIDCEFNDNIAIAGNDERGAGAIAFFSSKTCTVTDSRFSDNKGINGGAINSLQGKLTVRNSHFVGNDTTAAFFGAGEENDFLRGYGGAIYTDRASEPSEPSGSVDLVNCFFKLNKARGCGGAIYLYTGKQDAVTITSCTFLNNEVFPLPGSSAGTGGGLVQMSNGTNAGLTISSTAFANNKAQNQGGGIWVMNAPATIVNCTFSGNQVLGTSDTYSDVGGAMALYSPANIVNTTIADNFANWVGGGISVADDKVVTVQNTIFSNNTAANGAENWGIQQHTSRELVDLGGNFQWPAKQTENYNDCNATSSITIADPLLGPLQQIENDFVRPLLAGSPAIDKGVPSGAPSKDQRGVIRPLDGDGILGASVDSGSYEFSPYPAPSIADVSPRSGVTGEMVNIIGSGFTAETKILFRDREVAVQFVNSNLLTFIIP
jgi:predicted outer membrane repeat protein